MNIKSILLYVKDLKASLDFYKRIGFNIEHEDKKSVLVSLQGFTFQLFDMAKVEFKLKDNNISKGEGVFVYIRINNVDSKYNELIRNNIKTSGEPIDWPWGNREFVVKDPDGYKLVFYNKLEGEKNSPTDIDSLLSKGLSQGFAGGTVMSGIKRAGFDFKSSHFEENKNIYHDEWYADRAGAGQEVVKVGDVTYSRVYAGGTLPVEELQKLGTDKGQIMTFLKKQMLVNGEKIRLHTDFTPEAEGDWQYSYKVTDTNPQIPLTMGKEVIYFKGQLVFEHDFVICPVD